MALLSQLDKVKITSEVGRKLQTTDIENSGTLTITIALTAGMNSETVIKDNKWTITTEVIPAT